MWCSPVFQAEPLLFLIFVNSFSLHEHKHKRFCLKQSIRKCTDDMLYNDIIHSVNKWFEANKLSPNLEQTKYLSFSKQSTRGSIPLRLPTITFITFNGIKVKGESFVKFLGVITDEKLGRNKHIEL